jgi:hypothetical protein
VRLAALTALLTLILAASPSADELQRYAQDTWRSFDRLVDARTGLPSDNASPDGTKAAYTSPTNIGAYLWSTVAARDLHLISKHEAHTRLARTLGSVYSPGGFFDAVNVQTGEVARHWLALDQGMIMAALDNALTHDRLQGYLAPTLQAAVRPLLAAEEFSAR